ncbi:MAG: carboxypeptidase regulatory-like domain-containing protein [Acidobacteriaceae bacterium]
MNKLYWFGSSANVSLSLVKRSLGAFMALALLFVFLPVGHAQTTATASGTVQDPTGAVVPGAQVTLVNEATQDTRVATTTDSGFFAFPSLVPGTYSVKATAKGFVPKELTGIILHAGDSRSILGLTLAVGSATQSVTVQAEVNIIPMTTGSRSDVLSYKDIQNVDLEGRDVTEMLKVLPGVVETPNGLSNGASFNALTVTAQTSSVGNGLNVSGAEYRGPQQLLSDGVNVIDPGDMGGSIGTINPDMVQEMTVLTSNFGADQEFGPVVISTISKSGTDHYHGEAYFDARNDVLNANDWQSNHQGKPKGGAAYYYPGGNIGGYVPKTHKKLFFWGGYERWLQNQGNANVLESYIPSPEMMAGDFTNDNADNKVLCPSGFGPTLTGWCQDLTGTSYSDGTTAIANPTAVPGYDASTNTDNGQSVPTQFILPSSTALSSFWPKANANPATTPSGYNYYQPIINHVNGWVWRARVDWNMSDNTKFYVSYQQEFSSSLDQGNGAHIYWTPGGSVPYPGGGLFQYSYTKTAAGHFIHIFNATTTNELIASWGYGNLPNEPANPSGSSRVAFGYPTSPGYAEVFSPGSKLAPAYNGGGTNEFPDFSQGDDYEPSGIYQVRKEDPAFADNFTKIVGSHTIKAGAFTQNTANYQGGGQQMNGSFGGFGQSNNPFFGYLVGSPKNQTADFIMGSVTGYNEANKSPNSDMAYQIVSGYLNDNWKVSNRLNVEIGARFEHVGHWYDRTGTGMAVFIADKVASDYYSGKAEPGFYWHSNDPGVPLSGMPNRLFFLSPRFGMSYDVFGNGRTMVRGGWGAYRWQDQYNDYASDLQTAQNIRTYNLPGNTEVLESQIGLIPTPACGNIPACAKIQPAPIAGQKGFTPGTGQYGSYTGASPTDYGIPLTYSWNLTVDQQLPWNTLLDVGYVGSSSSQMDNDGESSNGSAFPGLADQNKTPVGALFLPDPETGIVANNPENVSKDDTTGLPNGNSLSDYHPFGYAYGTNQVIMHQSTFFSNYNALQASITKRTGKFVFDFNFTWQKQLGTAAFQVDPFTTRANYGVLNVDRPFLFNSDYIYQFGELVHGNNPVVRGVVNGWTISGISSWQQGGSLQQENGSPGNFSLGISYTGLPANANALGIGSGVGSATYYGTDAGLNIMPVLTCNPKSSLGKNQLLNQACFGAPAIGQYGGKNFPFFANAAYIENDLALYKTFEVRGAQNVQFRISAFNWMNHPLRQFSGGNQLQLRYNMDYATKAITLNTAGDSSTWGVLDTKAGAPNQRIIELNVKYNF